MSAKKEYKHICPICNKEFISNYKETIFCSKKCIGLNKIKPITWENINGCHVCTSHCKNESGYCQITANNKKYKLHRYIYEQYHNIILSKDQVVMHWCDNRACINIEHLKLGTQKENIQDMYNKGRGWFQKNPVYKPNKTKPKFPWKTSTEAMQKHNKEYGVWNKGTKYGETDAYKRSNETRNRNQEEKNRKIYEDKINGLSNQELSDKYMTCIRSIQQSVKKHKDLIDNK